MFLRVQKKSNTNIKIYIYSILLLICCVFLFVLPKAGAVEGINQQINFQGRLLTSEGATVPDVFIILNSKSIKMAMDKVLVIQPARQPEY